MWVIQFAALTIGGPLPLTPNARRNPSAAVQNAMRRVAIGRPYARATVASSGGAPEGPPTRA
jgi:hypothetical protein